MESALGRWLGIVLATVYAAMMIAEVAVRVIDEAGTGPILFWGLSLSSAAWADGAGEKVTIATARTTAAAREIWTCVSARRNVVGKGVPFGDACER